MNALRRTASLLLMLVFALAVAIAEDVAKMPKPTAYVDDFAQVMTPDGKAQVEAICREVHDKTKAQIFFVTIQSLDGNTIESFANDLFHNWGIGEKKTDRGVLVLLAIKDHKRRIEVGYGLEGILPDAKAGDIGRDMVPALKVNDYDEAALTGVQELAKVIAADSKVELSTVGEVTEQNSAPATETLPVVPPAPDGFWASGLWIGAIGPVLFLGFIGFIILMAIRQARLGRTGSGGVGFIDSGSNFGSSDSSSSFSTNSSSDSGFSGGDGGDSGGGGASGDW